MTAHPEISHLAREERIRAIAYAIWEEEGRPDGRDEAHWLQAVELVEAEAGEPVWLQREPVMAGEQSTEVEKATTLEELAKRITGIKAA